ncbi:MAG: hypothetical protein ABR556_03340 [Pyrinomonadaceae bacterium]
MASPAAKVESTPTIPQGWQRMEVAEKFVFYMPLDLKKTESIGDYFGPNAAFSNGHLDFNYQYATEDLCSDHGSISKEISYRVSALDFAGKSGKLQTWGDERSGRFFVTLCFRDIGDGKTRLHFGAATKAQHEIVVARQIFASVQFR